MNIKLVATDMDGTLLDSQKRLPKDFKKWVLDHKDIKTIIASGRQYFTLEKDFKNIRDNLLFIAENGGLVFDQGQIIYKDAMDKDVVLECISKIENISRASMLVCGAKNAYMLASSDEEVMRNASMYYERLEYVSDLRKEVEKDDIVKIAVFFPDESAEAYYHEFKNMPDVVSSVLSGVSWVDVANKTVNKGSAIEAVQKKYDISKEETMAFGDYLNDYTMLQAAGESYAMENGHPDVKKIAKYVADTNDNDGVMKILRELN